MGGNSSVCATKDGHQRRMSRVVSAGMTMTSMSQEANLELVTLADGRAVGVRPIGPSDLDELRRAIGEADPDTIRRRFLGGRAPRTEAELRRLVTVDHVGREAFVAFGPDGRGVGIARYEALPDGASAEFAVAVDPQWRHVGLATSLLTRLMRAALRNGITTIHVDFLAANREVAQLVRDAGGRPTVEAGVAQDDLLIDPALVERLDDE